MDDEINEDLIRYDVLMQEALLGVVRRVIIDAGKFGLPGEHHFYITFRSQAPGVRLSNRLREKYPEEMTIVLQHQFWDLVVGDDSFEVGLSFGGVPERLVVPFDALSGFYDPSVQFGLKFTPEETHADNDLETDSISSDVLERLEILNAHEKNAKKKKDKTDKISADEPAQSGDENKNELGNNPDNSTASTQAKVVDFSSFKKKK